MPVRGGAFFTRLRQEDDVAVERDVAALQLQHHHQRGGEVVLVVHRAAPVDVAAVAVGAERAVLPLLRVHVDGVEVADDEQRPLPARSLEPRHDVRAVGVGGQQLHRNALGLEHLLHVVGRRLLHAGRVARVDPDQRLEVPQRFCLERDEIRLERCLGGGRADGDQGQNGGEQRVAHGEPSVASIPAIAARPRWRGDGQRGVAAGALGAATPRPPGRTRRHADDAFERPAERRFRLVAKPRGKLAERSAILLEPRQRGVHLRPRRVVHRRLAHELREPRRERGSRHANRRRERGQRPGAARVAVHEGDGAADLGVAKGPQPAGAGRGLARDPRANRLDDEDVGQPRDHRVAAGPHLPRLGRHEAQRALNPVALGRAPHVHGNHFRQHLDQVAGCGVIEADHAADHGRGRAASAVAEDFVPIADELARQVEQPGRGHALGADQAMSLAVGHERQVAGPQFTRRGPFHLEPAPACGDDVKHQARLERRQRKRPRLGELRAAVKDPGHPQQMQRFAQRIDRGPGVCHRAVWAPDSRIVQSIWTNEHEIATHEH